MTAWYADNNTHNDDSQMAAHVSSKRPIVGLCLKRYTVSRNGKAMRLHNKVDIPTEIGLPHFIQDDYADPDGSLAKNFKLSLQAFVCHRGNSVNSGHYISIVRGTSADATPVGRNSPNQAVDDPSRFWMRFDDMAEERVTLVDVHKALETESPYLLFYQVLPIDEDAAEANLKRANTASVSSSSIPELDVVHSHHAQKAEADGGSSVPSHRSFEATDQESSGKPQTPDSSVKRHSTHSDTANDHLKVNTGVNTSGAATPTTHPDNESKEGGDKRSGSSAGQGHRLQPGNSVLRDRSQNNEKRISTAISLFAGLLGKEKVGDESIPMTVEDDGDEDTKDKEKEDSETRSRHERPTTAEKAEKRESRPSRVRSRDFLRGKEKQKVRDKSGIRDRNGKRIDRECTIM